MQTTHTVENAFKDRGFTFEDIVLRGELGGIKAVAAYLDLRIQSFTSLIIENASDAEFVERLQSAINAFEHAKRIYLQVYEYQSSKK